MTTNTKMRKEPKKENAKLKNIYALLFLVLLTGFVHAANLSFSPPTSQVALGEEFEVNVTVSNVVDIYSFQFDMAYDPVFLQYVSITKGPFLSSDGAGTFEVPPNNSTPGLLDNYAVTRISTSTGVSGNGVLATARFKSLVEGVSTLSLLQTLLYDSNATEPQEIPHTIQNGSVNSIDCDVDGDGYSSILCGGTDCNDNNINEHPGQTWYKDADGDLYSDGITLIQCPRPVNYKASSELVQTSGDCNDNNPSINPDSAEICDGIDNNCAAGIDEGFNNESCQFVCEASGYNFDLSRPSPLTCCGNNPNEDGPFQSLETSCTDGSDNDCDSFIDIYDSDCSGVCTNAGEDDYWISGQPDCNQCDYDDDNDADQPGDWSSYPAGTADRCDVDCGTVGAIVQAISFELTEATCDGIDNDCDGFVDEGVQNTYYRDSDGDGYGNPFVNQTACTQPDEYVSNNGDCNDNNINEHPGQTWYKDADGDGYSDGTLLIQCTRPTNYYVTSELTQTSGDCNDDYANVNPAELEMCNGVDDNCVGGIDEGFSAESCQFVCEASGFNYDLSRSAGLMCCGNDPNEDSPYQITELACSDSSDNDCDGFIDLLDSDCSGTCSGSGEDDFWISGQPDCNQCNYDGDNDADQPGDWSSYPAGTADRCDANCGTVTQTVQRSSYQAIEATCDGIDNDCDGSIDEGVKTTYYYDFDGDGYGNPSDSAQACSLPLGYSTNNQDCNDVDSREYPGQIWYRDLDGDLYSNGATLVQCSRPTNYYLASEISTSGDCNDNNPSINPDSAEICDGVDNNCAGDVDEGFNNESCQFVCEASGFNYDLSRSAGLMCCGNDPNEDSPYQITELACSDSSDNDCDGFIDLLDSDCSGTCSGSGEDDFWISGQPDCNQCNYDGDNDADQPGDWSSYPLGTEDRCDSNCGVVSQTINLSNFETTESSCYDNLDNDCDGFVDVFDVDCDLIRYDINRDGFVNIADVSMAAMQFDFACDTLNLWCDGRDVTRNGVINIQDLSAIGLHFT